MIAPILWARLAALVMRLTQSLFTLEEVALVCYVDDPLSVLRSNFGSSIGSSFSNVVFPFVTTWAMVE